MHLPTFSLRRAILIGAAAATICGAAAGRRAQARQTEPLRAFPSLRWVLDTAGEHAPEVVAQRGALQSADATMVGARLSPLSNPYLEVFADRRLSSSTGPTVQGNFWVPVEISGQRGRRVSESEALSAWQRTELIGARARAMGTALATYGTALVQAERARFLTSVVATSREEAAYYEGRFKQGDATLWDAKLAAVEVARNTVALQQAQADLTRVLAQLASLVGVSAIPAPKGPIEAPADKAWTQLARSLDELAARAPVVVASQREAGYFDRLRSREAVEAHAPFNFIVSAARGDLGDARVGGGLAWTLPTFRKNQGEQARAKAEQNRALEERQINEVRTHASLRGLAEEQRQVRQALLDLQEQGQPAAEAALAAALGVQRAGKGDLLHILAARRDLALMKVSALSLINRQWTLLADFVALTGEVP